MYDETDSVTARHYDAAYAALPELGDDVDFYRDLAREAGGPVLEIGCGTGRVLERIAADGLPCTGLDASPEMLGKLLSQGTKLAGQVGISEKGYRTVINCRDYGGQSVAGLKFIDPGHPDYRPGVLPRWLPKACVSRFRLSDRQRARRGMLAPIEL